MLTKLGETLGRWAPRSGPGDPLATIRGAWVGLVGIDVARAAQPVALVNETLAIITTSSAWSHQLAFLEPQIVRGIKALSPELVVTRLRFRVGTIRTAVAGAPRPGPAPGAARPVRQPLGAPRDAGEALARFRSTVEASRAAHRGRGGAFCDECGTPVRVRGRCLPCDDWARAALEARCQRLLFDCPWLRPQDVLDMLPGLDAAAYDAIRRQLLRAWWDEMKLAQKRAKLPRPVPPDRMRLRKIASSYVLLETKLDPNRLEMDSAVRRNALGELYEFIRGVEQAANA